MSTGATMEAVTMPIKWHLAKVMKARRWTNRALAAELDMHENSISRLKKRKVMPQIDSDFLSNLCRILECTPNDLIEYIEDPDPK
ncbi:helix-turn-helix domain-containing protein [Laspinema palackyanum]